MRTLIFFFYISVRIATNDSTLLQFYCATFSLPRCMLRCVYECIVVCMSASVSRLVVLGGVVQNVKLSRSSWSEWVRVHMREMMFVRVRAHTLIA